MEQAAGYIENSTNQFNVRTMGEGTTTEELARIQIKNRGGEPIYNSNIRIGDVARIEDGLSDIQRIALVNGHEGLGIGIKKQHGSNAVAVAHEVKDRLEKLQALLPSDIKIAVAYDSTKFVEDAIHETEITLILSALITGLLCFLFLGSLSSTINVFLSIPTSVMGTFFILYLFNFTLNFFTLLGLSLAIGIVVDDAIMVLENIVRHFHMGKSKVFASLDGAREITFAALAATLAVVAIFLPVAFMHGVIGKFFFQFGITISAAVFLSLIEALTITPMRCSQFLSISPSRYTKITEQLFQGLSRYYQKILATALRHRWLVMIISLAIFVISLCLTKLIPQEFLPSQDQGAYLIRIQTPINSSLNFTKTRLLQAEAILRQQHPEIDHFFSSVGGFTSYSGAADGPATDSQVNSALIYVTMKPKGQRRIHQNESMNQVRQELNAIPDLTAIPQELTNRNFIAGRGLPIELNLRGPDYDQLQATANKVITALKASGEVTDIDTDFRVGMPEVRIYPDRDQATACGVSIDTIANTVQSAIGGIVQGRFSNADRRYDVRLRLEGSERLNPEDILKLQVRTDYGELIPISEVVHLETVNTYQTIARRLRERSITIYANVMPGKSQAEALTKAEKVTESLLPPGIRLFLSGGAQTFRETIIDLLFALGLGLVISYMILASQFNSYIHPLVVLMALPFSLTGALAALLLTHQSINLYSLIGIILLMGIVKKNSILLIEFTNQKRFVEGLPVREAILAACPIRLRPIIMTSLATLVAAVPPALALGPGAESRIPMAITILGGVSVSTLLTLIVVPCAYSLFTHFESPSLESSLYIDSETTKEVSL